MSAATYVNDPFLNFAAYDSIRNKIKTQLKQADNYPFPERLDVFKKILPFERCFALQGEAGLAGICHASLDNTPKRLASILQAKKPQAKKLVGKDKSKQEPPPADDKKIDVVWKVSSDIDRVLEHEYNTMKSLETVRKFCPHFVLSYALVPTQLSYNFILFERNSSKREKEEASEDEKWYLWDRDHIFLPNNILLMEYVAPYSLYHVQRYADRNVLNSLILQTILALHIGQTKVEFNHYDLHSDNVLVRNCEEDSLFIYKFNNNDTVIVPTYGRYAVLIDYGNAHFKKVEEFPHQASIYHYRHGMQSTYFDPIYDYHHFLFSLFDDLESGSREHRYIYNQLLFEFQPYRIFKKSGWKDCPNHVFALTWEVCQKEAKRWSKQIGQKFYNTFVDNNCVQCIEAMTLANRPPLKEVKLDHLLSVFQSYFPSSKHKIESMNDMIGFVTYEYCRMNELLFSLAKKDVDDHWDTRCLFLIRESCDILYKQGSYKTVAFSKDQFTVMKSLLRQNAVMKPIPEQFDCVEFLKIVHMMSKVVYHLFCVHNSPNRDMIEQGNKQMQWKNGLDIYKWLRQNLPLRNTTTSETKLYVWDIQNEQAYTVANECKPYMSDEQIIALVNEHDKRKK